MMRTQRWCRLSVLAATLLILLLAAAEAPPADAADCPPPQEGAQLALTMAYAADRTVDMSGQDTTKMGAVAGQRVSCVFDSLATGWSVVWGPVVTVAQNPSEPAKEGTCQYLSNTLNGLAGKKGKYVPQNTMMVARKNDTSQYFIAIAGTNLFSSFDWCTEDWDNSLTGWPTGSPPAGTQVTQGTLDGLGVLQKMEDPGRQSLLDYLTTAAGGGPISVTVTGHSLGGALAPAMALWLDNMRGTWDKNNTAKPSAIAIYAFAGVTPGNQEFAGYLNGRFKGDSLAVINNTYDVVPHAWNDKTMGKLVDLYASAFILPGIVRLIIENAKKKASAAFTRLGDGKQQQCITGTLLKLGQLTADKCSLLKGMGIIEPYVKETLYQHICAYPDQIGPKDLLATDGDCDRQYPWS